MPPDPAHCLSPLSLTILVARGVSGEEFPAATGGGCVLDSGDAVEDNGGEVVSTAVVRGEAAVSDGLPTVTVGEGNGVPTVSDGGEAITNDTTGDVGGADAGGALHPPPHRLWQRRPRSVLLVLVLLLLLGGPRVRMDVVSVAVYPRLKGVGRRRGKTIIIFSGGLPLLLKVMPVVGSMAESVPACNVAMWALTKAPFVISNPVFVLVRFLRWWW